jgi:hypothetical protein
VDLFSPQQGVIGRASGENKGRTKKATRSQEETRGRERQMSAAFAKDVLASKSRYVHLDDPKSKGELGWGRAQLGVSSGEGKEEGGDRKSRRKKKAGRRMLWLECVSQSSCVRNFIPTATVMRGRPFKRCKVMGES